MDGTFHGIFVNMTGCIKVWNLEDREQWSSHLGEVAREHGGDVTGEDGHERKAAKLWGQQAGCLAWRMVLAAFMGLELSDAAVEGAEPGQERNGEMSIKDCCRFWRQKKSWRKECQVHQELLAQGKMAKQQCQP